MNKFILIIISTFLVYPVWGGTISIAPQLNWSGETAVVEVVNRGNEAASQVQSQLSFLETEKFGALWDQLVPNQPLREEFYLGDVLPSRSGVYPVQVLIKYADANGYSFSSLLIKQILVGKGRRAALHLQVKPCELSEQGQMSCRVANLGGQTIQASCRLELSPELRVIDPLRQIRLEPGQEMQLKFSVRNYTATPSSTYPAYLVAEYDQGEFHFTALGAATVTVVLRGDRSQVWFIGAGVVVLLGAGLAIWLGLRKRPQASKG